MGVVGVRLCSRLAVVAVSVLALVVATAAASTSGGSVSVLSKRGVYKLTVSPRPATAPVGRLHTWTVRSARRKERRCAARTSPLSATCLRTVTVCRPSRGRERPGAWALRDRGDEVPDGRPWYVEFRIVAAPVATARASALPARRLGVARARPPRARTRRCVRLLAVLALLLFRDDASAMPLTSAELRQLRSLSVDALQPADDPSNRYARQPGSRRARASSCSPTSA